MLQSQSMQRNEALQIWMSLNLYQCTVLSNRCDGKSGNSHRVLAESLQRNKVYRTRDTTWYVHARVQTHQA